MLPDPATLPPVAAIRRGGVTLSGRQIGDEALPPALALHGGPGLDHHVLLPLVLRLPRFRWTLPDLPAHGDSPFPTNGEAGLQWIEQRLERWTAHAGPVELLLAHSLGAWFAVHLLRRRILTPRIAVLIAPPVPHGEAGKKRRASVAPLLDPDLTAEESLRQHLAAECPEGIPEDLERSISMSRLRHPREYGSLLRSVGRAMEKPPRGISGGTRLLVICGSEDRTTPPSEATSLVNLSENAELAIVEGAGHWAFAEKGDEVAEIVRRFAGGA